MIEEVTDHLVESNFIQREHYSTIHQSQQETTILLFEKRPMEGQKDLHETAFLQFYSPSNVCNFRRGAPPVSSIA